MKKLTLLLIALVGLSATSCRQTDQMLNSDDSETLKQVEQINTTKPKSHQNEPVLSLDGDPLPPPKH